MIFFKIEIFIKDCVHLDCSPTNINFIHFEGNCDNEYFKGHVLAHGVDTQIITPGKFTSLSARYILSGYDYTGVKTNIFIENNGYIDSLNIMHTKPKIYTDSVALKWLETDLKYGTFEQIGNRSFIVLKDRE